MSQRAAHLLGRSSAFQGVPEPVLLTLAGKSRFARVMAGQAVFRQGQGASSLYLVESGLLKVSRPVAGGRELLIMLGGPRQLVAGVSAFCEGAEYSADAVALEDSVVLQLEAAAVRTLTGRSPALAQAVLAHFARRHADLLARMEELLFTDLNARLARWLLDQALTAGGCPLPTNSQLASVLGTVPELVSRKLGEFYRQGYIGLQRRTVRVLNEPALHRLADRHSSP